jgi:hypothetical protein
MARSKEPRTARQRTPRVYRKAEVGTWTDSRFQALSAAPPNGQTLWLYLLTSPRTNALPGVVVGREAVMADDLGWSVEGFRDAFREVIREGMADADWKAGVVVLKRALFDGNEQPREIARPASINVIKAWSKAFESVPDCDLKYEYLRRLQSFCYALPDAFRDVFDDAFTDAFAKASRMSSRIQDSGLRTQDSGENASHSPSRDPVTHGTGAQLARGTGTLDSGAVRAALESAVAVRRTLGDRIWDRLNEIRKQVAAEIRVEAMPLHPMDKGRKDLADRIAECGDDAADRCDHALEVLEADARKSRSLQWLCGLSFTAASWQLLMSKPKIRRGSSTISPEPIAQRRRGSVLHRDDHFVEFGDDGKPLHWWPITESSTSDGPGPGEQEFLFAEYRPNQWRAERGAS